MAIDTAYARLNDALAPLVGVLGRGQIGIAVSGGVDSMTLALIAHRFGAGEYVMCHAVSAAVPASATERVKRYASDEGWCLRIIDAGEMQDPDYIRNPVNRCYFCKSGLYSAVAGVGLNTVFSGTNLDDLSDWRPGLEAAKELGVRHPFVEVRVGKQQIRNFALALGCADLSELPASPCLSSRIETDLPISPERLAMVETVEQWVSGMVAASAIRCRVRASVLVLEIDRAALAGLGAQGLTEIRDGVSRLARCAGERRPVEIRPYMQGSAFVGAPHAGSSG